MNHSWKYAGGWGHWGLVARRMRRSNRPLPRQLCEDWRPVKWNRLLQYLRSTSCSQRSLNDSLTLSLSSLFTCLLNSTSGDFHLSSGGLTAIVSLHRVWFLLFSLPESDYFIPLSITFTRCLIISFEFQVFESIPYSIYCIMDRHSQHNTAVHISRS